MVADRIRPVIFGYYATWFLRGGFLPYCVRSPFEAYIKGEGCLVGLYSPLTKDNANVIVGNTKYCALLLAFKHRNLEVAEELLSLGADPMRCSGYPDIFFGNDCNHGPTQARRLYDIYRHAGIRHSDPQALLGKQALQHCIPGIELALSNGAVLNMADATGRTALHYATQDASEGAIATTAFLISLGGNPTLRIAGRRTAYEEAQLRLGAAGNWSKLEAALRGQECK